VEHIADHVPELLPYLALPAGWRVLIAPGYEDVWYDETLIADGEVCSLCGGRLQSHDRHQRFTLPDPVLDLPERERTPGTWMSHTTAATSDMMQVPGLGAFVRALLPVKLRGGHTTTSGVWLGINPADLQHLYTIWYKPEYRDVTVDGRLANAIPPWGLLGVPVTAVVRTADETPYRDRSPDELLERVLRHEWPHDILLAGTESS
jgi:hypothetical protein